MSVFLRSCGDERVCCAFPHSINRFTYEMFGLGLDETPNKWTTTNHPIHKRTWKYVSPAKQRMNPCTKLKVMGKFCRSGVKMRAAKSAPKSAVAPAAMRPCSCLWLCLGTGVGVGVQERVCAYMCVALDNRGEYVHI